jgi:GTP pyrophosphokinase
MDDTGRLVTRLVPLDYELKGGEIVDIVTSGAVHPTRDWLSFARTAAARNKIRRYLKTYEREINLQLGRERLDIALKTAGTAGLDEQAETSLGQLCSEKPPTAYFLKKYGTLNDVYVALGREDLHVEDIMQALLPLVQQVQTGDTRESKSNGHYSKDGESGPPVKLARCCYPIPGDAIVGLLSVGKGLIVHRSDCRTLRRRRDTSHTPVEVNWLQIEPEYYLAPVTIVAHDRAGLLRDVAAVVADAGINMTSVTSTTNASLQKAVITAILELAAEGALDQLEHVFRRLRQVKNVVSVDRRL